MGFWRIRNITSIGFFYKNRRVTWRVLLKRFGSKCIINFLMEYFFFNQLTETKTSFLHLIPSNRGVQVVSLQDGGFLIFYRKVSFPIHLRHIESKKNSVTFAKFFIYNGYQTLFFVVRIQLSNIN